MSVQEVLNQGRIVLSGWGSLEIPGFPGNLSKGWLHPDFLLRLFRDEPFDYFALQPLGSMHGTAYSAISPGWIAGPVFKPYLVWWKKPFSVKAIQEVPLLIREILGKTGENRSNTALENGETYFDIWGAEASGGFLREQGCLWEFSWKSLPVGRVQMITGILGESLKKSGAVVLLDLEALCCLASPAVSGDKPCWGKNLDLQNILAWRDFPRQPLKILGAEALARIQKDLASGSLLEAYHQLLALLEQAVQSENCGEIDAPGRKAELEEGLKPLLKEFAHLALGAPEKPAKGSSGRFAAVTPAMVETSEANTK